MDNKIICSCCGISKSEDNYYLSRKFELTTKMDLCKSCFHEEYRNSNDKLQFFRKYDIPFIYDLWNELYGKHYHNALSAYIKNINSLPQYKSLTWKDSKLEADKDFKLPEEIFKENIVENIKKEIDALSIKIKKTRESEDFGTYKNLIIAYRDILNLYDRYTYKCE